jgi:hypothetical protein
VAAVVDEAAAAAVELIALEGDVPSLGELLGGVVEHAASRATTGAMHAARAM